MTTETIIKAELQPVRLVWHDGEIVDLNEGDTALVEARTGGFKLIEVNPAFEDG